MTIGADTVIYPFVTLEGTTTIGTGCVLDPGVHLVDVTVGDDVHLKTGTVAESSVIENDASVGPYAHLRPGTRLGPHVKIGNFVETKKAVSPDSKPWRLRFSSRSCSLHPGSTGR